MHGVASFDKWLNWFYVLLSVGKGQGMSRRLSKLQFISVDAEKNTLIEVKQPSHICWLLGEIITVHTRARRPGGLVLNTQTGRIDVTLFLFSYLQKCRCVFFFLCRDPPPRFLNVHTALMH